MFDTFISEARHDSLARLRPAPQVRSRSGQVERCAGFLARVWASPSYQKVTRETASWSTKILSSTGTPNAGSSPRVKVFSRRPKFAAMQSADFSRGQKTGPHIWLSFGARSMEDTTSSFQRYPKPFHSPH